MNSLSYLSITSLYLILFYGCYALLLHRNTFFELNRAYLLTSIVLSLMLPFVELPTGTADSLPVGTLTLPIFVVGVASSDQSYSLTLTQWIWLVYAFGVAVMLVRLGLNLRAITNLIKRGTSERRPGLILVRLPDDSTPSFSFGRYLVLNYTDALTPSDALMRHEEAHINQFHTADVLFLELVQAMFWFNPVLWLYKRALQEIHEFLADRTAVRQVSASEVTLNQASVQPTYAQQLVAYALDSPFTALTTPFASKSTLKQRIVMLQKPASHRRALLSYALVLPLAACLVMCTQSEQDHSQSVVAPITGQASARKAVKVDGEIFTVVEHVPEFPGGMEALGNYLFQNLKYPAAARNANAQGRVFVSFVVTKTGEITDVNVLKGIGFGTEEEAIRVVTQMPKWKPAMHGGKVVNVKFNLPINFQMDDKTAAATTQPAFFSFPTNDADIQKLYKHFIVNGKEVAFSEFKKYDKAAIVEASSSEQAIKLETK